MCSVLRHPPIGLRVKRGINWHAVTQMVMGWDTTMAQPDDHNMVQVQWDNGLADYYIVGFKGFYELAITDEENGTFVHGTYMYTVA